MPDTQGNSFPALVLMRSLLPQLRRSERAIAQQFLADPAATAKLPIVELARRCGTSTASVVRFCHSLGYQRYKALCMDVLNEAMLESFETANLPEASGDIDRGDTLSDIVAKISTAETLSIADTAKTLNLESLQQAAQAISASERVDIFGVGASAFVAWDFQQKLTRIGRTALSWQDAHSAWTSAATLRPGTVAVAVSHSGATSDTIGYLSLAHASGATTVVLTNHLGSPITEYADVTLTTAARETGFRSGALGSRIAQLMVMDCLFIAVAEIHYDESMAAIRRTYAAIQHLASRA
ncbi:MAG: MurR/RpiR family transcriptional regulator [Propionibacteriaceae bacterium]|nr:MurR/RpiR family transcriptional regulator [Propionibacteriaceae bacterium]